MRPRLYLSPPHMGRDERRFVEEAFTSNYIAPLGPQVDAFEREFSEIVGIPFSVALSSCTAALHLALICAGIGPGDTVVSSTLTFIGGVNPIRYIGATPVFIDADEHNWNMDLNLLAEELDELTRQGKSPRALVATELYGQCLDLDLLLSLSKQYDIPVIIDAAESLGSAYTGNRSRSETKAVAFSFNGNKIITTSGGGMLCSAEREFIEQARFLSQQARDPAAHYEHSQIGFNYRMSNVLAAIGRGQLNVLKERIAAKKLIFKRYTERLRDIPGISFMPEAVFGLCNRWLTVVLINPKEFGNNREAVRLKLEEENIETRPLWKPMHLQPVFKGCRCVRGRVAENLFNDGLCLPSGTQMTDDDVDRVSASILAARR